MPYLLLAANNITAHKKNGKYNIIVSLHSWRLFCHEDDKNDRQLREDNDATFCFNAILQSYAHLLSEVAADTGF